ncbi:uncharacterized protein [Typha angustifolia]|uniref:uncharacterized protein n=1 Tax=Typha angustifolia TaxID=59011 RepID=UPI003C2C202C
MDSSPATTWIEMLGGVIHESKRVVSAHSRHFLALSVLFLLPLSSLLVAFPSIPFSFISNPSPYPPHSLLRSSSSSPPFSAASSSIIIAVFAATLLLTLSASAAVAHSVHRGFFGRPVKLLPTLRSLPASLGRLLLTLLAAVLPVALLVTLVSSLLLLSLKSVYFFHFSNTHLAVILIYSVFSTISTIGLIYILLNWSLAGAIAIMESSFGFGTLKRSARLICGMRLAALCLFLFFAAGIGSMLWGFSLGRAAGEAGGWSKVVPVVARTVFGSGIIAVLLLYSIVTNVVLYLYCKALHGELAEEIAGEFASEYVCLPFDNQKAPHIVSVILQ